MTNYPVVLKISRLDATSFVSLRYCLSASSATFENLLFSEKLGSSVHLNSPFHVNCVLGICGITLGYSTTGVYMTDEYGGLFKYYRSTCISTASWIIPSKNNFYSWRRSMPCGSVGLWYVRLQVLRKFLLLQLSTCTQWGGHRKTGI